MKHHLRLIKYLFLLVHISYICTSDVLATDDVIKEIERNYNVNITYRQKLILSNDIIRNDYYRKHYIYLAEDLFLDSLTYTQNRNLRSTQRPKKVVFITGRLHINGISTFILQGSDLMIVTDGNIPVIT